MPFLRLRAALKDAVAGRRWGGGAAIGNGCPSPPAAKRSRPERGRGAPPHHGRHGARTAPNYDGRAVFLGQNG